LLALLVALLLDSALGDPPWLWDRLPHPVVLIGRMVSWLELRLLSPSAPAERKRRAGTITTLLVVGGSAAVGWLLQAILAVPGEALWLGALMSPLIADRNLHQHVDAVARGLDDGLGPGRAAVRHVVGRDPESLDEAGVARAAIESAAENFGDGMVAPALFAALFGLPGILAYKAINTLDSMIGYQNPRYLDFGRSAARLDDLVNWPAARLAGGLLVLAAGPHARSAWRAMLRDAPKHRSPNAGWPEAAMAGALGLRLAGPRRYAGTVVDDAWMGDGRADADPRDIRRALRLLRRAWWLILILLVMAAIALHLRA
jgi:adenosylcobinamide-phosphate synthase